MWWRARSYTTYLSSTAAESTIRVSFNTIPFFLSYYRSFLPFFVLLFFIFINVFFSPYL